MSAATLLRRGSRARIALTMLLSLAATGAMQFWAQCEREAAVIAAPAASSAQASLSDLNSFSLAMMLGGLRGPLVMFLWTSSENQKSQRDLEDFDTKVEWIRLLQPEFDTVHIFQMWNKAYNISAQMTSLANKYAAILDALHYGETLHRPHDLNILVAQAHIWFDKLGNNPDVLEKEYYHEKVMEQTRWSASAAIENPGQRHFRLEPMLDPQGNILPKYLEPHWPLRPVAPSAGGELNDGSELQYLRQFQPFPYGISPLAIGYDYYKRAQVLMDTTLQKPKEVSSGVVASRPAVTLKLWCQWELERGRRLESEALGLAPEPPVPQWWINQSAAQREPRARQLLAVSLLLGPNAIKNAAPAAQALYRFGMAQKIARVDAAEYARYKKDYASNFLIYAQHAEELQALDLEAQADEDFLGLNLGRSDDFAATQQAYQKVITYLQFFMLKRYTDDETAAQVLGSSQMRMALQPKQFSPAQWSGLFNDAQRLIQENRRTEAEPKIREEMLSVIERAQGRIGVLKARVAAPH